MQGLTIKEWLAAQGLSQYAELLEQQRIDLDVLRDLAERDLQDLGIPLGDRKRLLKAIQASVPFLPNNDQPVSQARQGERPAERRQLTVLFCDLVGSTALSQRLDPEKLRDVMEAYQRTCAQIVARYEGHIAQYLGDGLMVYFGWPQAHEDDAVRAIRAALDIVAAISDLEISEPVEARVGVHTGLVVVGATGHGDAAVPKGAVGDTPNIAARLQAIADRSAVVVSERTLSAAKGLFDYVDLGAQQLKGIEQPMRLYRMTSPRSVESSFEAAHSDSTITPLVGREEEIALLLRRWEQAKDAEGQVVIVSGEPGIGKSRLTRLLKERIGQDPHLTLRYQCSPHHVHSALYPVIAQFERAAGFTRQDDVEAKLDKMEHVLVGESGQIARSAPLFAAMLSLPTSRYAAPGVSPQKHKEMTLEALATQVEALAYRKPVLMLFEDAHWIDPTTQEALDLLVPRLRERSVLMILTCRPEYTSRWRDQAHVTALGLNRLGRRQAGQLIASVTGQRHLPQEVVDQILDHTDGVPLFIEELTRSVLESGMLIPSGDQYALRAPIAGFAIPTSLRDSLLARLDRLAPIKEIAQIGACIGREFSFGLIAQVSTLREDDLERTLQELVTGGLVYRRGTPPDATYTFKHALLQDAAYDSLLTSRRQQLHARIAHSLEESSSERMAAEPELLAHHHTQAGDLRIAIPLWGKAGELAWHRVALREAIASFQKGLSLVRQLPPSADTDELELSIREPLNAVWAAFRGWAAPEVADNATAIVQVAERQGRPQSLRIGLFALSFSTYTQGRVAESLPWAQRLLAEGEKAQDVELQMLGHRAGLVARFCLGQLHEARHHAQQLLAHGTPQWSGRWLQLIGQDVKTHVGIWFGHCTWSLGYPDQAIQMSDEACAHARATGQLFGLAYALVRNADIFFHRCEPQRLLERVEEAKRIAREQSIPLLYNSLIPAVEGLGRLRNGELPEAIRLLRLGIDYWVGLGGHLYNPFLRAAIAEALSLQGDLSGALDLINQCVEQIERPGWEERWYLAEILRLKGWIFMRQDQDAEAERHLRASIDCAREQHAKSWELRSSTTLATLLIAQGQKAAAYEILAPVYEWFTEGFDTKDLREARSLLEELRH